MYDTKNRANSGQGITGVDTPKCTATYEAGHTDCDGDALGGACRLRKPCIELRKFCLAEKYEPSKLASALSVKEIRAFHAGRLELKVVGDTQGRRLHKITQQKRVKTKPIFRKKHWALYSEFERAMVESFRRHRIVNCLAQWTHHMKIVLLPSYNKKVALRTGILYPVAKTKGRDIERVQWFYSNAKYGDKHLVEIKPLNKPARLRIWMPFPIAELELRAAPELITELGLNARKGIQTFFILRTASIRLIKLSVFALKIMIDSGYLGVSEFGIANMSEEGG